MTKGAANTKRCTCGDCGTWFDTTRVRKYCPACSAPDAARRRHSRQQAERRATYGRARLCVDCDQPMLPPGVVKKPNEYDHARGCPKAPR